MWSEADPGAAPSAIPTTIGVGSDVGDRRRDDLAGERVRLDQDELRSLEQAGDVTGPVASVGAAIEDHARRETQVLGVLEPLRPGRERLRGPTLPADHLEADGVERRSSDALEGGGRSAAHANSSATRGMRSIVSRSYGAGIRTMTVSKPSSMNGRSASATSVGAPRSGAAAHVVDAVVREERRIDALGFRLVVADEDREADRLLDGRDVAPDVRRGAVLGEDLEPRLGFVHGPARVPAVGAHGHGPERLAGPGTADEDRQVGLDRARRAQRVVERVEAALVAEPLAIEQATHKHHRFVEAIEPLADAGPKWMP